MKVTQVVLRDSMQVMTARGANETTTNLRPGAKRTLTLKGDCIWVEIEGSKEVQLIPMQANVRYVRAERE